MKNLCEQMWSENCRYIRNLCEYKLSDSHKADECISEVYTALVQALENKTEILNPKAWLTAVAKNKIIDFYDSDRKNNAVVVSLSAFGESVGSHDSYSFDEVSDDEIELIKNKVLERLDEREKVIIEDYYQRGKKIKMIATERNLSEVNVKQILFRAREKIKSNAKKELNRYIEQRKDK